MSLKYGRKIDLIKIFLPFILLQKKLLKNYQKILVIIFSLVIY